MKEISNCRLCKSNDLLLVLNLGEQFLTGVFPSIDSRDVSSGPLALVWCNHCNLLQLQHSYDPSELYGDNYGYRSGLNPMMVEHLHTMTDSIIQKYNVKAGDNVLDIGSNDATLLNSYRVKDLNRIGIDPTGMKFSDYYPPEIELIPDFFSADLLAGKKFKVITSISMFYDLEDPYSFVHDISKSLQLDGIWHFEQSYMPSMLRLNSYDTICHEHLEYYSLNPIKILLEKCDLKIIDVKMNAVNGGSFAVTACHKNSQFTSNCAVIEWLLDQENNMGINTPNPFRNFEKRVHEHKHDLVNLIKKLNASGKVVHGYGASTKGNVLLQFCNFDSTDIPFIAEINKDKFGKITPGSNIPIISDAESKKMKPDFYLVLPWHFKSGILKNEEQYLKEGGSLIFPFPEIEII
jgi:hypothetical protein